MRDIHVLSLWGETSVSFGSRRHEKVTKASLERLYKVLRERCSYRKMEPPISGMLTGFHALDVEVNHE